MSDPTNTSTPRTDAVTQRDVTNPLSESGWRREYRRLQDCSEQLERELVAVTAERDALRRIAHTLYLFTDWAEPFDGDDEDRCEPCDIQLSWGDVHRVWAARDTLEKHMEKVKQYE